MMIVAFLMLASSPGPSSTCGTAVVGSYFQTVPLKDADGRVIDNLKVDGGKLAEELPVVKCGDALVLVRWRGQLATVDRARVRFTQTIVVCPEGGMAGSAENHGNAASMGALDPRCPQRKSKPGEVR